MESTIKVDNRIFPDSYSIEGLTFTRCFYVAGGFIKIGKIVIVNLRIKVVTAGTNDYITGLPIPLSNNTATFLHATDIGAVMINGDTGTIRATLDVDDYVFSGVYICD